MFLQLSQTWEMNCQIFLSQLLLMLNLSLTLIIGTVVRSSPISQITWWHFMTPGVVISIEITFVFTCFTSYGITLWRSHLSVIDDTNISGSSLDQEVRSAGRRKKSKLIVTWNDTFSCPTKMNVNNFIESTFKLRKFLYHHFCQIWYYLSQLLHVQHMWKVT